MEPKNIVLAVAPQEQRAAQGYHATLAHLAYRISPAGRLLRSTGLSLQGGLLVVCDAGFPALPFEPDPLCRDIIAEVTTRGFSGVVADFAGEPKPALAAFVIELDRQLLVRRVPLYLNPNYMTGTKHACALISSEVTGGSLEVCIQEALRLHGQGRVALEVMLLHMDFLLPSPDGEGRRLHPDELETLRQKVQPMTFFSPELCAKYFTYMGSDRHAHFVLFDDVTTVLAKLRLAQKLGLTQVFLLYSEMAPLLGELFAELAPSAAVRE